MFFYPPSKIREIVAKVSWAKRETIVEEWTFVYDEADASFQELREVQPVLINPMIGQVVCQFKKLYFFYKVNLTAKQAWLKRCPE